ncbi:MAG TPA: LysM peptidoglycan-binding domain-containing protein [Sedimentisphaerales bacterium]|nr:LysM peptidoglycan-binding domain-containing protein [Sedimentisphaerales bacterium]
MTSDAKIGLLLGLVFIFIIAFIINGLPRFGSNRENNDLTNRMLETQNRQLGLAAEERKVIEQNEPIIRYNGPLPVGMSGDASYARYSTPLPGGASGEVEGSRPGMLNPPESVQAPPPSVDVVREVWPKVYTVGEGDILATIAQKFYGPEEGNKRVNVMRIFEANRKILKSADEILVGQNLLIPALMGPSQPQQAGIFGGSMFETRRSIGEILLGGSSAKSGTEYVVKEGDNLWKIAAQQLGDGNRYKEIFKLNQDRLKNEDEVVVGTSLRIPAR